MIYFSPIIILATSTSSYVNLSFIMTLAVCYFAIREIDAHRCQLIKLAVGPDF